MHNNPEKPAKIWYTIPVHKFNISTNNCFEHGDAIKRANPNYKIRPAPKIDLKNKPVYNSG